MTNKLPELMEAHPRLFRGKPPGVASELPAGWFDIVDVLCSDIDALLGWEPERLEITQVKEKMGALRFYYSLEGAEDMFIDIHTDRGIRTIVDKAEGPAFMDQIRSLVSTASLRSTTTCQDCGAMGVRAARGGWVGTLCPPHAEEREHRRESDKE